MSRYFTVDTHAPDGDDVFRSRERLDLVRIGARRSASPRTSPAPASAASSTAAALTTAAHRSPSPGSQTARIPSRSGQRIGPETQGPTASRTWTVDGPADLSITAGPQNGDLTNDPTPSFAFSSTDSGASFSCRLDGGGFAACTSPLTTSTLSDGDHRFTVKATDTAQNTAAVSRAFTVDTTAPAVTISSGPADGSATNDPTPTFRFSPTEPGSTFQCRYEGHGFSACSGARSDTAASPLADGPPHVLGPGDRRARETWATSSTSSSWSTPRHPSWRSGARARRRPTERRRRRPSP